MQNLHLIITFDKQHIVTGSVPAIFFEPRLLDNYAGRQIWVVHGYDNDPREIYQIPEIRSYFRALHKSYPGWLAWLDLAQTSNLLFVTCALAAAPLCTPLASGDKTAWLNRAALTEFLSADLRACNLRGHEGMTIAQFVRRAVSILEALGVAVPGVT